MAREATLRAVFAIEERILAKLFHSPREVHGGEEDKIPLFVTGPAKLAPLSRSS